MTNYNERLDEIFAPLINSPSLTLTTTYWDEAKQALTSLITTEVLNVIDEIEEELPEPRSLGAQAYCRKTLSTLNQIRKRYSDELR